MKKVEHLVDLTAYCATFLFVLHIEQQRHFADQISVLAVHETLKYSDLLASASPFYNSKTQLMHMGGRIGMGGSGRRDMEFLEENSTHYKLVLPHKSPLTGALILNIHQRNQCCSPAFARTVLNEQFYLPRATSTVKMVTRKCTACALARSSLKRIEPPTGNVQNFRIPRPAGDECNRPYTVCYYDFKGPLRVNDDRRFKPTKKKKAKEPTDEFGQQLKVYILSVTCALTRHTTFEGSED